MSACLVGCGNRGSESTPALGLTHLRLVSMCTWPNARVFVPVPHSKPRFHSRPRVPTPTDVNNSNRMASLARARAVVALVVAMLCAATATTATTTAARAAGTLPPRVRVPKSSTFTVAAWGVSAPNLALSGSRRAGRQVVVVDLDAVQAADVAAWKRAGHIVQCYFSVGTMEPFRADVKANKAAWQSAVVAQMADWDEGWLDLTKLPLLKQLQMPRFTRAKAKGCDALELDNVDCYDNDECASNTGNNLSRAQVMALQITYNTWQVETAHALGMSVSLKNALDLIPKMVDLYDFAVNEQCAQFNECSAYKPFLAQNKAVLNVEYKTNAAWCAKARSLGIRSLQCPTGAGGGVCQANKPWVACDAAVVPLPAVSTTTASP